MFIAVIVACSVLLWILVYVCIQYDKCNDFLYKCDMDIKRMKDEHMRMHSFYNKKLSTTTTTTVGNKLSRFDSMKRKV